MSTLVRLRMVFKIAMILSVLGLRNYLNYSMYRNVYSYSGGFISSRICSIRLLDTSSTVSR